MRKRDMHAKVRVDLTESMTNIGREAGSANKRKIRTKIEIGNGGIKRRLTKILGCRYRWKQRRAQRRTWACWGRPSCGRGWRASQSSRAPMWTATELPPPRWGRCWLDSSPFRFRMVVLSRLVTDNAEVWWGLVWTVLLNREMLNAHLQSNVKPQGLGSVL